MVNNVIVLPRKAATFPISKKRTLTDDDSDEESTSQRPAPPLRRSPSLESDVSRGSRHTNEETRRIVRCRFVVKPAHPSLLDFKR